MSEPARFLGAFGQALSSMSLYPEGHPGRERAADTAYKALHDLQSTDARPLFTFLGGRIIYDREPLSELKTWEWGPRLAQVGIQRLEFTQPVGRADFDEFLDMAMARLSSAVDTAVVRPMRSTAIRYGTVAVQGATAMGDDGPMPTATINFSLADEVETLRWIQQEVQTDRSVPLAEAEAVVRSLAVAMHGDGQVMLPLLQLKEFDQYTTTHSLNVSVLSMALAEYRGMGPQGVRQVGVAGLLHDLGKVRIPLEVLTKPGALTAEERQIMQRHPADGARMLMESGQRLELAAVVAYEHHIMLDGRGYPAMRFRRECHDASKLVHVCDIYDALRTDRPYRDAWSSEVALAYLEGRAGIELDPDLTQAFVTMMRQGETRTATLSPDIVAVQVA